MIRNVGKYDYLQGNRHRETGAVTIKHVYKNKDGVPYKFVNLCEPTVMTTLEMKHMLNSMVRTIRKADGR